MENLSLDQFKMKFDREAVYIMKNNKTPGMSIKITIKGKTFYERSFGSRELSGQQPASSNTIYGIASMTKSITSLAVLLLQEKNQLNIYDPVSKYIPFKLGKADNPITIHHLMSHGSGVPDLNTYVFPINNEDLNFNNTVHIPMNNWDDFYFHINDYDETIREPGRNFYYSNDGYTLLSQVIEKVSGISYESFVKREILDKLGMTRSTFSRKELESLTDVSKGYDDHFEGKNLKRQPKPHTTGLFNSGAGGLNSTVNDLTKYLSLHINKGIFNNNRIISEKLILEMIKPHNPHSKSVKFLFDFKNEGYGYGLTVYEFLGKKVVSHSGSSGVSGGVYCFVPELELTYAQLQNITSSPNYLYVYALCLLFGEDPNAKVPYFKRRNHYKTLIGHYKAYKEILEADITEKDGLLYIQEKGDDVSKPLIPKINDPEVMEFYIIEDFGRLDVTFQKLENEIIFDYERNIMHKRENHSKFNFK